MCYFLHGNGLFSQKQRRLHEHVLNGSEKVTQSSPNFHFLRTVNLVSVFNFSKKVIQIQCQLQLELSNLVNSQFCSVMQTSFGLFYQCCIRIWFNSSVISEKTNRFKENKARQIFRKTNISYPLIYTRTYAFRKFQRAPVLRFTLLVIYLRIKDC